MALIVLSPISYAEADPNSIRCLADNVYWEARNQSVKGMIAVAWVVRNRVKDDRFPDDYCKVIYEGPQRPSWKNPNILYPIRHKCQFSWYCDGKADDIPNSDQFIYDIAHAVAFKVYYGHLGDFSQGATHYHADYVRPSWADTKTLDTVVGNHLFYIWD